MPRLILQAGVIVIKTHDHSCFAIILIGKREGELVALLSLSYRCLLSVVLLFLAVS